MTTQTLAEAAKLINNEKVQGVVETIVTVDPLYEYLPWIGIMGQSVTVNGEATLADAQHLAVGGTITAKAPGTYDPKVFTLTTTIGDAELNGLVAATSGSAGVDQMALEVAAKSKSVGYKMRDGLAAGSGSGANMNGLAVLCDAAQYTTASAGQALSFELLDELLDLVKNGAEFIVMSKKALRKYRALCRAFNGNNETVARQRADGTTLHMDAYLGIPIFKSERLSETETANGAALTGGALTSIYAGKFDDGTKKAGLAMIYPEGMPAGIQITNVGEAETKDEQIVRVKCYSNYALFNKLALARLTSIDLSL